MQGEVHGPAVATGTTVTSANSGSFNSDGKTVKFPCMPAIKQIN